MKYPELSPGSVRLHWQSKLREAGSRNRRPFSPVDSPFLQLPALFEYIDYGGEKFLLLSGRIENKPAPVITKITSTSKILANQMNCGNFVYVMHHSSDRQKALTGTYRWAQQYRFWAVKVRDRIHQWACISPAYDWPWERGSAKTRSTAFSSDLSCVLLWRSCFTSGAEPFVT